MKTVVARIKRMSKGQDIFYYKVNIIYQRKIGKKMHLFKGYELECVSRAKNINDLNKDSKALFFLEKCMNSKTKKYNFRVSKILVQKKIGFSEYYKEDSYVSDFK